MDLGVPRSSRGVGTKKALKMHKSRKPTPGDGWTPDGSAVDMSHDASFHSFERIAPSNHGIKQLGSVCRFRLDFRSFQPKRGCRNHQIAANLAKGDQDQKDGEGLAQNARYDGQWIANDRQPGKQQ